MEQHEEYGTGEQPDPFGASETPDYWTSVGLAGVIFGVVHAVLYFTGSYMAINSEPTGSLFQMFMGGITCLLTAFAGMVAIWHYNREYGVTMKLGRGALIGLYTGIAVAVIITLLSQIWYLIDPTFNERMMEYSITSIEMSDMFNEEMKQAMIDGTYTEYQNIQSLGTILKNVLVLSALYGFLNMLTGMLGVALFARQKDEI